MKREGSFTPREVLRSVRRRRIVELMVLGGQYFGDAILEVGRMWVKERNKTKKKKK